MQRKNNWKLVSWCSCCLANVWFLWSSKLGWLLSNSITGCSTWPRLLHKKLSLTRCRCCLQSRCTEKTSEKASPTNLPRSIWPMECLSSWLLQTRGNYPSNESVLTSAQILGRCIPLYYTYNRYPAVNAFSSSLQSTDIQVQWTWQMTIFIIALVAIKIQNNWIY